MPLEDPPRNAPGPCPANARHASNPRNIAAGNKRGRHDRAVGDSRPSFRWIEPPASTTWSGPIHTGGITDLPELAFIEIP